MKKLVSLIVLSALLIVNAVTVSATESSYLPAEQSDKEYTFVDFDFEDVSQIPSGVGYTNNKDAVGTVEISQDPIKGGKSIKSNPRKVWHGINLQRFPGTCNAGDKYFYEFSIKAKSYDTVLMLLNSNKYFSMSFNSPKNMACTWNTLPLENPYQLDKWYHVVMQIEPSDTTGTVTAFLNGKKVGTSSNSMYKKDVFNSEKWPTSRIQFNNSETAEYWFDDYKVWKSQTGYDPVLAGDTATVSSDTLTVSEDAISYSGLNTISELNSQITEVNGSTVLYFTNDNTQIKDMNTALSDNVRLVVRSRSGATVNEYRLQESVISSDEYIITDSEISDVPYYTTPEEFKKNIIVKEGNTVVLNNANIFVDNNTTLTVGTKVYTVKMADYFMTDFNNTSFGVLNQNGFIDAGKAKAAPTLEMSDRGNKALKISYAAPGGLNHFNILNSVYGNKEIKDMDTINFEFSFKAEEPVTSSFTFGGLRLLTLTKDGSMKTINENMSLNKAYEINKWHKVLISIKKNGLVDIDGNNRKTYTCFRIYFDGEQLNAPNREDGLFANSGINLQTGLNRLTLASAPDGKGLPFWVDDVRVYGAADTEFDTKITSSDYRISNSKIYVPHGSDIAQIMGEQLVYPDTATVAVRSKDNADITDSPELWDMDSKLLITDYTENKTEVYTFEYEKDIIVKNDIITADVAYKGIVGNLTLYAAMYDNNGKLTEVRMVEGDAALPLSMDIKDICDGNGKVMLWNDNNVPCADVIGFIKGAEK